MFVAPGSVPDFPHRLSKAAAAQVASNWWRLLLNGIVLIVCGVLIFSIDWTVSDLAVFLGALFIFEGLLWALTAGVDGRARGANVITGLLSVATGILLLVWPGPGLVAVAIVLGSWLIVSGGLAIVAAFAMREVFPDWWLLLLLGLLQIPLGVLALADPGATLAAIITVAGIWAVAIGTTRIILAFQVKRLPQTVDELWAAPGGSGNGVADTPRAQPPRTSGAGA
jgi:uncharacterized membrane protein HdeD (DUF308 family)